MTIILKVLTSASTFGVMFGGALRVGPPIFREISRRPALFLRVLVAVWILVPALTFLVVVVLGIRGTSAALLLLMSVCPGVPLLLASTRSVQGSMKTALLALVVTAIFEPWLIPYWTRILNLFQQVDLTVRPIHVLRVLVPTVFFPIVLGFVVRARWSRVVAPLIRASDIMYVIGVPISLAIVLWKGLPLLRHVPFLAFVATVIITLGDALIGYWAGGPRADDRKAVALAAALGNPALALAIIEVSFPGFQAGALLAIYLIVRGLVLIPVEWWLKWRLDRKDGKKGAR